MRFLHYFLDRWVTNTSSVKTICTWKNSLSLHCHKTITCLNIGLLKISPKFFLSPVILYTDGLQQTAVSWVICHSLSGFYRNYINFPETLVLKCCTNATASIIMFVCTLISLLICKRIWDYENIFLNSNLETFMKIQWYIPLLVQNGQ
jgi:hypothetical protein